ncbi:MAG: TetR/AcrR family transcriptional regulator [Nocardioides sp.]
MVEPTSPVRRGRGRPRDPETDVKITRAAAELMLRRGFDKTTVDEVAARAGVGKATVYRRWPSKEDLAVTAMETLYTQEFPDPDTGSIEGDLTQLYTTFITFANTEAGRSYMRMSVTESIRDERIAGLYRESMLRTEARARAILESAVERGEVRRDAGLDIAVQWLSGLVTTRVVAGCPVPTIDEVPAMVAFTLRGIRA